ncbi:MAG: 2-phospho-L-lactate guanylyltransferase [Pseudoxanthomonas sp.]
MTSWTICVPIKSGTAGKSRLSAALSVDQRAELVERMARHVLDTAAKVRGIDRVLVLSTQRPTWWDGTWAEAQPPEGDLNAHLQQWRAGFGSDPCLILHADLPGVTVAEIEALLDAANRSGIAMATDEAGQGSNALAIADGRSFVFEFGSESRSRHCTRNPDMTVLQLPGLAADVDLPMDVDRVLPEAQCTASVLRH